MRASAPTGLLLAAVAALAAAATWVAPGGGAPAVEQRRAEVERLQAELERLDAWAGAAAAAHNAAIDRLEGARARLADAERERRGAERDLRRSRAVLSRRVVDLYVRRPPSLVEVLLSTGSLSDAQAAGELMDRIARADARVLRDVRDRRARLQALVRERAEARREAARATDQARARRAEVESLISGRRALLQSARAELRRAMAAERARQARLAAQKRAQAEAARRAAAAPGGGTQAPAALPGGVSHVFPVAGPARYSDDWLVPRPGGRYHQGIDLFAPAGTPLVAVADGTIYRVGYSGISGNRLWLRDGQGTAFFYAHLQGFAPAAREGARVSAGTVIGYVGDTGDARGTSPHLHFEIHPGGGGPVRPYPIVSAWPRVG